VAAPAAEAKSARLKDKIAWLRQQMQCLRAMETRVRAAPDQQVSLTDPDARSMATSGKGTGVVGYNVQAAVDAKHHLIVAHEVTSVGNDRAQLADMAGRAQEATGRRHLTALADRGYFDGEEVLACERAGVVPYVPKPLTSGAKAEGRFGKQDFVRLPARRGRLPLPGRRAADVAVRQRRGRADRPYATTGPPRARRARSRPGARPARSAGSGVGSTRASSTPCRIGWTGRRR
jgi:hypothetical protein